MKTAFEKFRIFLLWFVLICLLVLMAAMYTPLNTWISEPLVRDESPQPADVIIVLGGGVVKDIDYLPFGPQERVQKGIELYQEGYADRIIMTGGQVEGEDYTESEKMREYAELLGAPSEVIIEEPEAVDTHENALYSKSIMERNEWEDALLVTSYFHTSRACAVFEKEEIDITCIAAYPSEGFQGSAFRNYIEFRSIIRDYLAKMYYQIKGYI